MDKLKMAHEYALEMARQGIPLKSCKELGWKYADAMQAEADGRVNKDRPDILKDDWMKEAEKDARFYGVGFVRFLNKDGFLSAERLDPKLVTLACNNQEEWQPDWSQAPKSMNYFFMNKDGSKYWTVNKPDKPNLSEHVMDCLECGGDCYAYASSQDYQGNWQDSLRKRP